MWRGSRTDNKLLSQYCSYLMVLPNNTIYKYCQQDNNSGVFDTYIPLRVVRSDWMGTREDPG
jgi:hypothetical protein